MVVISIQLAAYDHPMKSMFDVKIFMFGRKIVKKPKLKKKIS